jgi:hypothetical protein
MGILVTNFKERGGLLRRRSRPIGGELASG